MSNNFKNFLESRKPPPLIVNLLSYLQLKMKRSTKKKKEKEKDKGGR
jgi:hypothetical protein